MKKKRKQVNTLTRNDLAKSLSLEYGSTSEAYRFVGEFFEVLSQQIIETGEVRLHGFGRFRCLDKKPRVGRNPKTGKEVQISGRRVVSFIASGKFKNAMMMDDNDSE